ncbi:flagellar hook protein FlgE [Pseudomonas poae]|uniref:Flagellar hook protein FlgE n=1 Tax=Pseudomonas poae TaxID=200451 RepID=A0A2S9EKQ0_9PSED|nr:flagellar hook protein FlgE [Pseudomonas poae]PRA26798.1 flagellar hook protein FlgE [Pseudomonas poae]PRC15940.1 flagellar hook protein FlgE [Pseudomonas poae]
MAFSQALSGLSAASTDLNVVSNNISNSQTVGFKSSTTQFADVYSGADVGLGTQVSGVVQNFESGSLTTTDNSLDLAINGDGFFTFSDGTQTVYSRNGQLTLTADGYLENAAGDKLLGVNGVIQIPTTGMQASATTELDAELNLDASKDTITATFDQTNSSTYTYSTSATLYDSLGVSHTSTLYFTKSGENSWTVHTAIDGNLLADTQTVEFSSSGLITSGATGTYTYDPDNGAADIALTLDLTGTTQFGNDSAVSDISQNGYTSGSLVSFTIDETGTVVATYSNDQTKNIDQIQLATFSNENGLKANGDNTWLATTSSGQPLLGVAGSGSLGSILSGTTEDSNVDLTAELVNLIIAQRNFQANAKSVTAQSEVLQQAVNIGS